jgi:hypothetical protein
LHRPKLHYDLGEGATGVFFDVDWVIANPNTVDAPVTITFSKQDGTLIRQTRTIPAQGRVTIRVDDIPGLEFTLMGGRVSSDLGLPLGVERTMFWDARHYGGHTSAATTTSSTRWFFAEGAQGFFDTYVLFDNPQPRAVPVTLAFLMESGPPVLHTLTLNAFTRLTLQLATLPELLDRAFAIVVNAPEAIVVERAMYFGFTPPRDWTGGHASGGVPAPALEWLLPEGSTGTFFDTFVLLANPTRTAATVTLDFGLASGEIVSVTKAVPALSRLSINPEAEGDARLENTAFWTRVRSNVPIVSERSMYWESDPGELPWGEGHNSFGVTALAARHVLAEGRVGTEFDYATYVLLTNPSATPADVTVTFLRESGAPVVKTYTVPAASRLNVDVAVMAPQLHDESFGTLVEVTNGPPIAVERSMYWNVDGVLWSGGTNSLAMPIP